jgi:hypothetical protein
MTLIYPGSHIASIRAASVESRSSILQQANDRVGIAEKLAPSEVEIFGSSMCL